MCLAVETRKGGDSEERRGELGSTYIPQSCSLDVGGGHDWRDQGTLICRSSQSGKTQLAVTMLSIGRRLKDRAGRKPNDPNPFAADD